MARELESVLCGNCGKSFDLDHPQRLLVEKLTARGAALAILKCPNCWVSTGLDLKPKAETPELWKCPVSSCDGWVCHVVVERLPQWACGECGSFWKEKTNLIKEVTEICARFPYRSVFYADSGGRTHPSDVVPTPEISEKIEREPDDTHPGYERD